MDSITCKFSDFAISSLLSADGPNVGDVMNN